MKETDEVITAPCKGNWDGSIEHTNVMRLKAASHHPRLVISTDFWGLVIVLDVLWTKYTFKIDFVDVLSRLWENIDLVHCRCHPQARQRRPFYIPFQSKFYPFRHKIIAWCTSKVSYDLLVHIEWLSLWYGAFRQQWWNLQRPNAIQTTTTSNNIIEIRNHRLQHWYHNTFQWRKPTHRQLHARMMYNKRRLLLQQYVIARVCLDDDRVVFRFILTDTPRSNQWLLWNNKTNNYVSPFVYGRSKNLRSSIVVDRGVDAAVMSCGEHTRFEDGKNPTCRYRRGSAPLLW